MKITRPPKRLWPPLPHVAQLIERVQAAPDEDLPDVLDSVLEWPWPRGDLHHWAATLNRFDLILENTLSQYQISHLQLHHFTPRTKKLILSILRFTRLLLESCTNRKIYNSYEHLRSLLVTNDLDVLEETLHLLLRPAQQHSSSGGARAQELGQQSVVTQRLLTLGSVWPPLSAGVSMVDLADDKFTPGPGFDTVRLVVQRPTAEADTPPEPPRDRPPAPSRQSSMHRAPSTQAQTGQSATIDDTAPTEGRNLQRSRSHVSFAPGTAAGPPGTGGNGQHAAPSGAPQEMASVVVLRDLTSQGQDPKDVVADAIEQYKIPTESHFELFQRVRTVFSMYNSESRKKLLSCRLLALAVYGHVVSEWQASTELFMSSPEIARHVGALVSPEHKIDRSILSSAFYALEGLVKFRSRSTDVFTSIGVSVNHGALLQNLRMLTTDIEALPPLPDGTYDESLATYADSIFGLLAAVVNGHHMSHVAMIVGAGLMPLLVRIVQHCRSRQNLALRTVARAIGLIESFIYATPAAFTQFCDVGGPDTYVQRIKDEVDYDIANPEPEHARLITVRSEWAKPQDNLYGYLSLPSSTLIRNILKSISHMITATGTEQLRNLIETSLPESVIKIMENRLVFGPQVLAVAITIIGNLVHNEPTSLVVVQEKKIPEKLFDLITEDIEANFDLISCLATVCSAMCLNQAGLDLFNRRMIARKLMRLLLEHRHTEVLEDRDNAIIFGTSIDELVRHQPSARDDVIAGILTAIEQTNACAQDPARRMERHPTLDEASRQAGLTEPPKQVFDLEKVTPEESAEVRALARPSVTLADLFDDEDDRQGKKDDANIINGVISKMDVASRFMEGFFQTPSHIQAFVERDGLKELLKFYDAPGLPYNFLSSFASGSMANLLVLMTDPKATAVIHAMMVSATQSMTATKDMWDDKAWTAQGAPPAFSPTELFAPSDDATWARNNALFRNLVYLSTKLYAIGELYQTFSYASTRPPQALFPALNVSHSGDGVSFISQLGMLLRHTLWSNLLLKAAAPPRPAGSEGAPEAGKVPGPVQDIVNQLPSGAGKSTTEPVASEGSSSAVAQPDKSCDVSEAVRQNVKVMRYTISLMAQSLKAIHREVVRLLFFKAPADPMTRSSTFNTLGTIADTMIEGLRWRNSGNASNDMAYATVMIDWIDSVLYERKGSRVNVSLPLLHEFFRKGGISALVTQFNTMLAHMDKFFPEGADKTAIPESAEDANSLSQACGGLHVCLRMMNNLVIYRPAPDPLQVSTLSQQYSSFNQENMLTMIRLQIVAAVQSLWHKSWLQGMPLVIIRSLVKILLAVLGKDDPTGEQSSNERTNGNGSGLSMFGIPQPLVRDGGTNGRPFSGVPTVTSLLSGGTGSPATGEVNLTELGFTGGAISQVFGGPTSDARDSLVRLLANPQGTESSAPLEGSHGEGSTAPTSDSPRTSTPDAPAHLETPEPTRITLVDPLRSPSSGIIPKQYLADELQKYQKQVCEDLVGHILSLAQTHEPLVFEARDAVQLVPDKVGSIRNASRYIYEAHDKIVELTGASQTVECNAEMAKIRVQLHFLAIVLNTESLRQAIDIDVARHILQTLQRLGHTEQDWVRELGPHIFLIASEVFGWSEKLDSTAAYLESSWQHNEPPPTRPKADPDNTLGQFEADYLHLALSILRDDSPEKWNSESLLATYRLLVVLSRRPHLASQIANGEDELAVLLRPFKVGSPERIVPMCQSYLVTILRHMIEQPEVLKQLMFQMLRSAVHSTRGKHVMTTNLLNQVSSAVWRDPDSFFQVVKEHLELVDYNRSNPNARVRLIDDAQADKDGEGKASQSDKPTEGQATAPQAESSAAGAAAAAPAATAGAEPADTSAAGVDKTSGGRLPQTTEVSDHLIHFLISELTSGPSVSASVIASETAEQEAKKKAEAEAESSREQGKGKDPASTSGTSGADASTPGATESNKTGQDQIPPATPEQLQADQQLYYNGFILQTLAELLSSYDCCKLSLMNYTRKRTSTPAPALATSGIGNQHQPGKLRGTTVSTLFHELVALGAHADKDWRKCKALSNWLMSVLVALAADTTSNVSLQDLSADVVSVRKLVLDGLSKSIKDITASSEPLASKGGKILVLSDLCYRLLTVKPNQGSMYRQNEDLSLHMAKLMLEKNFVLVLTTTITDVDPSLPPAKEIIKSVLKPLDHLTKVAIRMGRAEKKESRDDVLIELSSDDGSDDSSEEEMEHDRNYRNETPDFYRNSSLGIHTGDLEPGTYEDEVDEDESGEDDEDIEMEEYDHEGPGSDVTSSDSDEDGDSGMDDDIEVEEMSDASEDSDSDEDDHEHDHNHDHSDEEDAFEDDWTETDDDEDEGDDSDGELDIVIEHDGHGGHDHMVPTLEVDEDNLGPAELGSVFESEGEEPMEVEEDDEGSSNDGYDAAGFGDLSLDDAYSGPPSNALDLFGANWAWVNPPPGAERPGSGALFVSDGDGMPWRSRLLDGGSRRNGGNDDVASHPLLVDQSAAQDGSSALVSRPPGRRQRFHGGLPHSALGLGLPMDPMGGSTMQLLEAILERAHGMPRGHAARFGVGEDPTATPDENRARSDNPEGDKPKPTDPVSVLQTFKPMSTTSRWLQDASLVHARPVNKLEHASLFRNELHATMLPAYWTAQQKRKEREAEKEAEAKRKAEEEEAARRKQEEEERAERERRQAEEAANAPPAQASDTEMVDASQPEADAAANTTEGAGGEQEERQTVTIGGEEVDITGSGMDPEFLLALPDEMRQEIVEQHLRERRAETLSRDQSASAIEPEFLAALPPEIRAEVIEQELIAQRIHQSQQRERERERASEQQDRDASRTAAPQPAPPATRTPPAPTAGADAATGDKNARRDAIQLLDRPGVLTLVRLLFFPELNPVQSGLHRVLASVSENSKTRTDVLRMLLNVLTEGTGTAAAVDRSYVAISNRINQAMSAPNKATKVSLHPAYPPPGQPVLSPISAHGEKAPFLMALRCIEALTHLVDVNSAAGEWFLRDDVKSSKKGKGKDKGMGGPPIGALLALLEHPVFMEHSQLLNNLIHALNLITKPLAKPAPERSAANQPEGGAVAEGTASAQDSSGAQAQTGAPTAESSAAPAQAEAAASGAQAATVNAPAPPTASTAPEGAPDESMATNLEADETMATDAPAGADSSNNGANDVLAPQIPPERLALVVRPLSTPISSRGFQSTLAVASNLAHVEGAKDIIRDSFMRSATDASQALMSDLDALLAVLPPKKPSEDQEPSEAPTPAPSTSTPPAEPEAMQGIESTGDSGGEALDKLQSPALATLASPASAQAVLLRSLRGLDYLLTGK